MKICLTHVSGASCDLVTYSAREFECKASISLIVIDSFIIRTFQISVSKDRVFPHFLVFFTEVASLLLPDFARRNVPGAFVKN